MSALHQELDEVAASTVRCARDHESILGSRLLRPRLQSKRRQQLSRRVDLDRELAGRLEEIVHRSYADQLAVIDDRHARADLLHLGQYVAGYEDRFALSSQVAQEVAHLYDAGGVEAVRRLIEDQNIGVVEQGKSQAESLLH